MEHRRDIHGHIVYGEDDAEKGLYYLDYEIDPEEARVFFQQAKLHGQAEFEDRHNRQFTLEYDHGAGSYRVIGREG